MLGKSVPGLLGCRKCARLASYIETLPPKRGLSRDDYWNGPVPGFGDPKARICLVGLAPGAHGANRTGRPFTGDGAGDFMYPLLFQAGFASQPHVSNAGDGLTLRDLYISNAVKCVPPDNKPLGSEFECCRPYLAQELESLSHLKVVLLLGQGAFNSYLRLLKSQGMVSRLADFPFGHGAVYKPLSGPVFAASYHTSRYNVQTRRITPAMFLELLEDVKKLAGGENG